MAKAAQLTWPKVWDDATRKYLSERELAEKANEHWYKKNKIRKDAQETPPEMRNLGVFMAELENQRKKFGVVADGSSMVLDSMAAIAAPLDLLMSQASDIAGAFFPGAPLLFGAVMYIFNAGKGVKGYFGVIEQLFSSVTVFIDNIRIHVQPKRGLREELENVVVRALVKVLDILRIVTVAVKEKALKAFWQNLYKDKSGDATTALSDLERLAKERDSTVQALTLRSVDDIAEDITEIRETMHRVDGNLLEVKTNLHEVRNDVQGGFQSVQLSIGSEFSEMKRLITHLRPGGDQSDPKPRDNKDSKDAKEDRGEKDREALDRYLDPDRTTADRLVKLCQTIIPDTAEWILQTPEFEEWQAKSEISVLWVSGIPGVGKSHLAAKIVERLEVMQTETAQDADGVRSRVVSFFCDFEINDSSDEGQENLQTEDYKHLNVALRTLAWQMAQKDRGYEKWLASRMPNDEDPEIIDDVPDQALWLRLFENGYFASLQKTSAFLVIDGVETISQQSRQSLMEILVSFSAKRVDLSDDLPGDHAVSSTNTTRPSKVKIIILGQSKLDDEILAHFESSQVRHISITEKENRKDIDKYILTSLRQSNKLKKLLTDKKFREETVEKLATASQGCFEMAALMINELSQRDHLNSFSEALSNPPRDIEQILQDILRHFGHTHTIQEIKDLNNLLAWVLYARRALTLAELNAAVGLESDDGPFLNIRDKIESEFSAYFSVTNIGRKNLSSKLNDTPLDDSVDPGQNNEKKQVQPRPENLRDSEDALLRLTHSSIARFFRSAAKVDINTKGIALGVTADAAHTRILKTCLRLLCAKEPAQSSGQPPDSDTLLSYAADNFMAHLIKLQPAQIPNEEKAYIARHLLQIFGDDQIIDRWLKSVESLPLLYSMNEVDQVWTFLSDDQLKQNLTTEELALITNTQTSNVRKILGPLARYMAREWLQNAVSKREAYEWFYALGFLEQLIDATNDQLTNESTPFLAQGPELSSASIHTVAEWVGFEKTALWHTQVVKVIYAYGKAEDALADCRAAIQLDSNFGDAYYYKAICHSYEENYSLAISDMQAACRLHGHFEDEDKTIGARWISWWQETLQNFDGGIQVLEDTLRQYPDDRDTVAQYIQLATKTSRFMEVLSCLRNLGNKLPAFLLSERAEGIQRYIRRAAQMTRRVNYLKRAYQTALIGAQDRRDEKEMARAGKALFMIRAENQEEDTAIELVKEVYRLEDGPKQLGDWGPYIGGLCELLFWGLHLNREDSESFSDHLNLLIYAEKNEHSPDTNALTYDNYIGGLFLGQLYRLHNRLDESKVYFKDRVALAMSLLEDGDVSNDWQAYDILSETMFKAGDEVNGKAARIVFLHEWRKSQAIDTTAQLSGDMSSDAIGTKLDKSKASDSGDIPKPANYEKDDANTVATLDSVTIEIPVENSVTISNTQVDGTQVLTNAPQAANKEPASNQAADDANVIDEILTDTPWDYSSCDGPCLRDYDKTDKMIHVCMNCYNTTYCNSCFNRYILPGTLPYKKCDLTHRFVLVTGPPKDLDDAKVVVGDSIRDREEWLNSIRTAWGLNEWHPASATLEKSPTTAGDRVTIETAVENRSSEEPEKSTSMECGMCDEKS